jgi:hypothetical protein
MIKSIGLVHKNRQKWGKNYDIFFDLKNIVPDSL